MRHPDGRAGVGGWGGGGMGEGLTTRGSLSLMGKIMAAKTYE